MLMVGRAIETGPITQNYIPRARESRNISLFAHDISRYKEGYLCHEVMEQAQWDLVP